MTTSLAASLPGHSPQQWATDFLTGIGAPATPKNVQTVVAWEQAESGGGGGLYNPLNTTQGGYNATGSINSVGVKNYATYADGLAATIHAFTSGATQYGYGKIRDALVAQNQPAAFAAVNSSSWGTHSLGGADITAAASSGYAAPTTQSGGGCPEGNLITFPGPIPNISRCEGRALLGATTMAGGLLLILVGLGFVAIGQRKAAIA